MSAPSQLPQMLSTYKAYYHARIPLLLIIYQKTQQSHFDKLFQTWNALWLSLKLNKQNESLMRMRKNWNSSWWVTFPLIFPSPHVAEWIICALNQHLVTILYCPPEQENMSSCTLSLPFYQVINNAFLIRRCYTMNKQCDNCSFKIHTNKATTESS